MMVDRLLALAAAAECHAVINRWKSIGYLKGSAGRTLFDMKAAGWELYATIYRELAGREGYWSMTPTQFAVSNEEHEQARREQIPQTGGIVTAPMKALIGEPSPSDDTPRKRALDALTREIYEAGLYGVMTEPEQERGDQ
jgi:hypothetical protein